MSDQVISIVLSTNNLLPKYWMRKSKRGDSHMIWKVKLWPYMPCKQFEAIYLDLSNYITFVGIWCLHSASWFNIGSENGISLYSFWFMNHRQFGRFKFAEKITECAYLQMVHALGVFFVKIRLHITCLKEKHLIWKIVKVPVLGILFKGTKEISDVLLRDR